MEVLSVFVLVLCATIAATLSQPVVQLPMGKVIGVQQSMSSSDIFYGIPFAEAPVGSRRWTQVGLLEDWDSLTSQFDSGVLDCTETPSVCFQRPYFSIYERMSEDCLHLSVWTPHNRQEGNLLPVLVYLHGGGFVAGSSIDKVISGENFNKNGIVFVSFNYRLNVFGFFNHPELTESGGFSPNFGLHDQLVAFEWVKKYISYFGGDPEQMSLLGHSAGSSSILMHLTQPLTKDQIPSESPFSVFKRAILHSPVLSGLGNNLEEMENWGQRVVSDLNLSGLSELRSLPASKLLNHVVGNHVPRFTFFHSSSYPHNIAPVTRGNGRDMFGGDSYLPSPIDCLLNSSVLFPRMSIIMGVTEAEGSLCLMAAFPIIAPSKKRYSDMLQLVFPNEFYDAVLSQYPFSRTEECSKSMMNCSFAPRSMISEISTDLYFRCPVRKVSAIWSENTSLYQFQFAYRPEFESSVFSQLGAFHGLDIALVFGTSSFLLGRPFNDLEMNISRSMNQMWSNFVKHGNPNSNTESDNNDNNDGLLWLTYSSYDGNGNENGNVLIISDELRAVSDMDRIAKQKCQVWDDMFPGEIHLSPKNELDGEPFFSWIINDVIFNSYLLIVRYGYLPALIKGVKGLFVCVVAVLVFWIYRCFLRKNTGRAKNKMKEQ